MPAEEMPAEKLPAEKMPAEKMPAEKMPAPAQSAPSREEIARILKDVIRIHRRGLGKIYGEAGDELDYNLEEPIKKGEEMAKILIARMGCPRPIAKDLTVLTLYDVIIFIGMF